MGLEGKKVFLLLGMSHDTISIVLFCYVVGRVGRKLNFGLGLC